MVIHKRIKQLEKDNVNLKDIMITLLLQDPTKNLTMEILNKLPLEVKYHVDIIRATLDTNIDWSDYVLEVPDEYCDLVLESICGIFVSYCRKGKVMLVELSMKIRAVKLCFKQRYPNIVEATEKYEDFYKRRVAPHIHTEWSELLIDDDIEY